MENTQLLVSGGRIDVDFEETGIAKSPGRTSGVVEVQRT
jgi:hypothetical protein